jgi:hypothetical protein
VERVQVLRPDGAVDAGIRPEEPFAVCVEFQPPRPDVALAVRVQDAGGRTLFESVLKGPWPSAAPGAPVVAWLHLDRCSLVDGDYGVVAVLAVEGREVGSAPAARPLRVRGGEGRPGGLLRLPHRWALDGQATVKAGASEVA